MFHNEEPWEKIDSNNDFDVPMGSYDGAELFELVGIFMQSELSDVINLADFGLYRDDGLGVMRRLGKPTIERKKKQIIQVFKRHGLRVTIQANLSAAQYLDVEFNLRCESYIDHIVNRTVRHCI